VNRHTRMIGGSTVATLNAVDSRSARIRFTFTNTVEPVALCRASSRWVATARPGVTNVAARPVKLMMRSFTGMTYWSHRVGTQRAPAVAADCLPRRWR
jgi:hypothetical protein